MPENQEKKSLTKTQKTGFVLLLIFAVLTIGLGGLQLRNTIYSPFVLKLSGPDSSLQLLNDEQTRLQSIDTDHDGLNDWEELNYYETSPYLPDTDSDGINDKTEIDNGDNPLCAKGEACESSTAESVVGEEPITSAIAATGVTPTDVINSSGLSGFTEGGEEFSALLAALEDPPKLRELLLKSGSITVEQLSKVDDATLVKTAKELLQNQMQPNNEVVNTPSSNTSTLNTTSTLP
ncbi:MAG: IclR-like protein transcriptional regulator [Candidatus Magasanikbacteria bacterium GW2011_GWC2_37_14]|uniref:IclR-like protein transcriptional regulator n=1 Tax=Candidatus Magasanikbacteria bacterium GW2011_GWC2_37_14 TaxID=1619046 RepID=A0A0G0JIR9_9BACT|nr:MAG: IclR-like protein transcriptional regulator [Candidatus Magasanikbacteria bacterium GW2011_GWC2_37_14]